MASHALNFLKSRSLSQLTSKRHLEEDFDKYLETEVKVRVAIDGWGQLVKAFQQLDSNHENHSHFASVLAAHKKRRKRKDTSNTLAKSLLETQIVFGSGFAESATSQRIMAESVFKSPIAKSALPKRVYTETQNELGQTEVHAALLKHHNPVLR